MLTSHNALLRKTEALEEWIVPNETEKQRTNDFNENDFEVIEFHENAAYTEEEWKMILSQSEFVPLELPRLCSSLLQGVPKDLRKRIWPFLANVEKLKKENLDKGITYESLLEKNCPHLYLIQKDIPRTFQSHKFFIHHRKERLQHLENVLKAYAVFDPEIGYTQGMNFLVGTLVYYLHLERTEKDYNVVDMDFESDVFWILVHIMYKKDWRNLYADNTPKLVELLDKLENRIKLELPQLYDLFQEYAVIPACFSQYYLTMMFYNSPLKFAKRVLEVFIVLGHEIISDLIFKMLTLCKEDILKKKEVEDLYPFLRSQLVQLTIEKYEKEFSNLVNKTIFAQPELDHSYHFK